MNKGSVVVGRRMATLLVGVLGLAAAAAVAAVATGHHHALGSVRPSHGPRLPLDLQAAVSSTVGAGRAGFALEREGDAFVARGGGLTATFRRGGPDFETRNGKLTLRLSGVGRREVTRRPASSAPTVRSNRVVYRRGDVREWYLNGPLGLEQGFTLASRPSGRGPLTLAITTRGLAPRKAGATIVFGDGALLYGGLGAVDSGGRSLPARLDVSGERILVSVDDRRARYPLTIDPFLQQGNRILAGGELGNGWFGFSVAISADGNTALVGGHIDNGAKGAAWVFRRTADVWSQEAKIAPSDEVGAGEFGSSVALSANGDTALIGARSDAGGKGAAWVFARSRLVARVIPWRRQAKLTADATSTVDPIRQFGASVDLTNDGNTALIGAPLAGGGGAAWVFTRSGGTWTNRTASFPLKPYFYDQASQFGASVALAGDGSIALIGAPGYYGGRGAAWYFLHEGITYLDTANGPAAPSNLTGPLGFGRSVALSDDGKTALVGAPLFGQGIAWAYVHEDCARATGCWTLQRGFIPLDVAGKAQLGSSVALSGDGDTALIGGPQDAAGRGALWAYVRSGTNWDQLGNRKIEAGGEVGGGVFGTSVSLTSDGHSAFVGAPKHDGGVGAVWWFGDRPTVTALAPASGPTTGGTKVTLAGTGFKHASGVKFGSVAAASFEILSPTLLTAVAPAHSPGTVDVAVNNSAGASLARAADRFTYIGPGSQSPPPQPTTQDRKVPTAPRRLQGSFRRRTLFLRWKASKDDVGVHHYELYRDGVLRKRVSGKKTRDSIRRFGTRRRTLFTLQALDAVGNRSKAATLKVIRRARPAGVPRVIPAWARRLYTWETSGKHGSRPALPHKVPAWYARWKAWRLQPYLFRP